MNRRVDFLRGQERRDKPLIAVKKPAFDSPPRSREPSTAARKPPQTAIKQQSVSRKSSDSATAVAGPSSVKGKGKEKNGPPRRSPSPPRVDPDAQEFGGGKYRFTEEEDKYLVKYARYRLSLDPDVSKAAICKSISEKVDILLYITSDPC